MFGFIERALHLGYGHENLRRTLSKTGNKSLRGTAGNLEKHEIETCYAR